MVDKIIQKRCSKGYVSSGTIKTKVLEISNPCKSALFFSDISGKKILPTDLHR